ncbi:hypothetical protein CLOSTMETH_02794 [[Clostridium] methylpentosum DSM 5476]|uniref:Uncharacterized protein n=1 Tax=[Clostridium] methylpentosum DSM 5476 TaxID=537013 RepID=C0EG03_9FIRM|nr:hypothetical protein CLOSTMETH_02794 [[Clostridium] methylpentosum DSM 5476]
MSVVFSFGNPFTFFSLSPVEPEILPIYSDQKDRGTDFSVPLSFWPEVCPKQGIEGYSLHYSKEKRLLIFSVPCFL